MRAGGYLLYVLVHPRRPGGRLPGRDADQHDRPHPYGICRAAGRSPDWGRPVLHGVDRLYLSRRRPGDCLHRYGDIRPGRKLPDRPIRRPGLAPPGHRLPAGRAAARPPRLHLLGGAIPARPGGRGGSFRHVAPQCRGADYGQPELGQRSDHPGWLQRQRWQVRDRFQLLGLWVRAGKVAPPRG